MKVLTPTANPVRLQGLDVIRGFALLGILLINALQMFIPYRYANMPVSVVAGESGAWSAWFVLHSMFDLKFLALFSLLFGAGFMLHWQRYQDQSAGFRWMYWRRLAVLAMFGLLHAVLLYPFDVLLLYAVCGFVLYLCRRWSAVTLIATGTGLFMVTVLELFLMEYTTSISLLQTGGCVVALIATIWLVRRRPPWMFVTAVTAVLGIALAVQFWMAPEIRSPVQEFQRMQQTATELAAMPDTELTTSVGDFVLPLNHEQAQQIRQQGDISDRIKLEQTAYRFGPQWLRTETLVDTFINLLFAFLFYFSWRTVGLFMIAAGLVKWGVLNSRHASIWRRTAVVGLGVGIPVSIVATALSAAHYSQPIPWLSFGRIIHELSSIAIALGAAALILLWSQGRWLVRLRELLAAAGRCALSNYIGQSFVMMLFATTLGWFGQLSRWQLVLLSLLVFILLAGLSRLWLSRFRMGPLEWLWRSATYGRLS